MNNPFEEIIFRLIKIESAIDHLQKNNAEAVETDKWLTLSELRQYLPGNPSAATIYGWSHRRQIPAHRFGKRLTFLKSEIDVWLKSKYKKTKVEIENDAADFIANRKLNNKKNKSL